MQTIQIFGLRLVFNPAGKLVPQFSCGVFFLDSTMTDADTIANAEDLWKLVEMVQETIGKDGVPLGVESFGPDSQWRPVARIRKLADSIKPAN